ncbi:MAG: ribonuclease N [Geodermatophilaceae bacterium]|nr:ribonuclease N [Geodermatophilaceae bacterium]
MAVRRTWQRRPLVGLVVLLAVVLAAYLASRDASGVADTESGLSVVAVAELPAEVRTTLELIERDGSFPYERDGAVFGNREELLPDQQVGYYREYTVPTPGEGDRGARRLVTGRDGEVYYSADHYESFVRVLDP